MGNNSEYSFSQSKQEKSKLNSVIPITSTLEEQYMSDILQKRPGFLQSPYICSVKNYEFVQQQKRTPINCENSKKLIVYYDNYDFSLADIPLIAYNYTQNQICWVLYCISEALLQFRNKRLHHGDISLQNIVKKGNAWQLVDKVFIRNDINAYQRVLEGEDGFVSPHQMERIRHGFIRQSPEIEESDDIFSLGMVALQLGSKKPSNKCYRQSFNRFYEKTIVENLRLTQNNYSKELSQLIKSMIQFDQTQRISLDNLKRNPMLFHINKFSLKPKGLPVRMTTSSENTHFRSNSASRIYSNGFAKNSYVSPHSPHSPHSLHGPQSREIIKTNHRTSFNGPKYSQSPNRLIYPSSSSLQNKNEAYLSYYQNGKRK